jgi:hypothetical protein
MRVDVVDHEGCVAGETKQEIGRQFGKPMAAMRDFMRDRGPGKCKEIAGEPQRADRFERLLGQAWAQGGETDQEKRQKADQRKRQIEIHRAKDAPALFERVSSSPLTSSANDPKTSAKARTTHVAHPPRSRAAAPSTSRFADP